MGKLVPSPHVCIFARPDLVSTAFCPPKTGCLTTNIEPCFCLEHFKGERGRRKHCKRSIESSCQISLCCPAMGWLLLPPTDRPPIAPERNTCDSSGMRQDRPCSSKMRRNQKPHTVSAMLYLDAVREVGQLRHIKDF